jgi:hypothetical protein
MVDVKFDGSNGSQGDLVSENILDDEELPSVSIVKVGTGEVMTREVQVHVHQEESQVHGDDHGRCFDQRGNKVVKLKDNLYKFNI